MKKIFTQFKALALTIGFLLSAMTVSAQLRFIAEQTGPNPIAPGEEGQIKVSLVTEEEIPVQGMEYTVNLPTGLSFKPSPKNPKKISLTAGAAVASLSPQGELGVGRILYISVGDPVELTAGTYEIATIDVVADNTYSGTNDIKLSNCLVGLPKTSENPDRELDDVTFPFVGKVQVDKVEISGEIPAKIYPMTEPFQLKAILTPDNADYEDVAWKSSNPDVATVDENGVVTPKVVGATTITATVKQPDEKKGVGSIDITVSPIILPTSIVIAMPEKTELKDEDQLQLKWTVEPDDAFDPSVKWTSSDEEIATVDANGLVIAHSKLGPVQITATSVGAPNVAESIELTIVETPVTKVIVTGEVSTVAIGSTVALAASVEPATATEKSVTWASSNEAVATVDKDGVVTGISEGVANITARATNGVESDLFEIKVVPVLVEKIEIIPGEVTMKAGETYQFETKVYPENASNKKVVWKTSRIAIADVDFKTGLVTAGAEVGTATITAHADDGSEVRATAIVTVVRTPVEKFSISGPASIQCGESGTMKAEIAPVTATATTADIIWTSSDKAIATVDENGTVIANNTPGKVTITALLNDDGTEHKAIWEINVVGIAATGITVAAESDNRQLKDGETLQLTATVTPSNATDKQVAWSSGDEKRATVDENGLVTAHAVTGPVTITATALGGDKVTTTIELEVIPTLVEKITITSEGDIHELKVGETLQLAYKVTPTNATERTVTYGLSDYDVASIDGNLVVTAKALGTVVVTLTADDNSGVTGTYEINVVPTPWSPETAFEPAEWELVVGESFTAALNILPEDATYKDYKISIEPEGVLSYEKGNGSVIFTALAEGKATVTATPVDGEGNEAQGQAVMTVTVNATPEVIDNDGVSVIEIDLPLNSTIALYGNTDNVVAWKVIEGDGAEIASAEDNQVVLRGTKMGTTVKIQATFSNGEVVTITVNVTEPIDVYTESVTLTPSNKIVYLGDSFTPSVTLSPADHTGETLNWSSSDESVATVNPEGEIVAVGYGVATITLTVTNSNGTTVSASCVVIVSSATGIDGTSTAGFAVTVNGREIIVTGLGETDHADVYNISGRLVATGKGNCIIPVSAGLYVVKADGKAVKVAVK